MELNQDFLLTLMDSAIAEARKAYEKGEVPVGAVIACQEEIIARAHNQMESKYDATAHAEILAIQAASAVKSNWRLNDCVMCVTLEPCTMCTGAICLARIPVLVYGAKDERMGALGSHCEQAKTEKGSFAPELVAGVSEKLCRELLQNFFREQRQELSSS